MPNDSSSLFHTRRPRVVATIGSLADWRLAEKLVPGAPNAPDWLELRADLLLESDTTLPGELRDLPLPILLTVRHPSEGGKGPSEPARRAAIYQRYWEQIAAINVELACASELSELLAEAGERGLPYILSAHDFSDTPPLDDLVAKTLQASLLGAALFKVATTTNSAGQVSTLMHWLETEKTLPLAAMGMGRLGKISRPLLAQLGSQLNYGYLDTPLVPGQWPAEELRHVIGSVFV